MRKLSTSAVDAGTPLAAWLARRIGCSTAEARAAVERGSVYVDGRRVRDPGRALAAGQKIAVHDEKPPPGGWRVAYEDEDVVIVDKPAGLAVQATRGAAGALDEQVAARFPGARALHRIDRDTSGLVMFTLRPSARARLQRDLEEGRLGRVYLAWVAGSPARDAFELDRPIDGRPARSEVRVAARGRGAARLEVRLVTGRTHQIRIHLAGAGHPILGDPLHAPPDVRARAPRLALHAWRLRWPGGEAESPPPAELMALVG